MKLSPPQRRAMALMHAATDGTIHSSGTVRRITVESLERRGMVTVKRTMTEREKRSRDGTVSRRTECTWSATVSVVMPEAEELEELDLIAASAQRVLRRSQRRHAAAYLALTTPTVQALPQPPDPADQRADFERFLTHDDPRLIIAVATLREMTGQKKADIPRAMPGVYTDFWKVTAPRNGGPERAELGRVCAPTRVEAAMAANALLNRRGGYDLERLSDTDADRTWVRDFRAGEVVLRLEATDAAYRVRSVTSGEALLERTDPVVAEKDARMLVGARLPAPREPARPPGRAHGTEETES